MQVEAEPPADASEVAERLAKELNVRGYEYALGGAIALSFWASPRGTMDVDLTLFLSPEQPAEVVWQLSEIGCEVSATEAAVSLREHGFCRCQYASYRVDVFVPKIPFYELARQRRRNVLLGNERVMVWDAETLSVFKMMFFRRKDIADVEQILQNQPPLDRAWVREQLVDMYGARDARVAQWDELVNEVKA
jgi:hypothetical protein